MAVGNIKAQAVYEDLREAVTDDGPTQIESYCVNCEGQVRVYLCR